MMDEGVFQVDKISFDIAVVNYFSFIFVITFLRFCVQQTLNIENKSVIAINSSLLVVFFLVPEEVVREVVDLMFWQS